MNFTESPISPMRFCKPQIGSLVEPVPGLDQKTVLFRCSGIPSEFAERPELAKWLAAVEEVAELENEMARGAPAVTVGLQSEWLAGLTDATRRMRSALGMLKVGADRESLADLLQPDGDYLLRRANECSSTQEGRPRVPHVPGGAIDFAALLERMANDLEALELICKHTQGKLVGLPSSLPKYRERRLIKNCAVLFRNFFGRLPPKRGWFGDEFMPYVGECIGFDIGHRIVGEVVSELAKDPGAP